MWDEKCLMDLVTLHFSEEEGFLCKLTFYGFSVLPVK